MGLGTVFIVTVIVVVGWSGVVEGAPLCTSKLGTRTVPKRKPVSNMSRGAW